MVSFAMVNIILPFLSCGICIICLFLFLVRMTLLLPVFSKTVSLMPFRLLVTFANRDRQP